jgi:tight adherence protein C
MSAIQELLRAITGSSETAFELALFVVMFLTAALFVSGIAAIRRSDDIEKRLQFGKNAAKQAGGISVRYGSGGNGVERLLAPFLRAVPNDREKLSIARRRLVQAGYYDPNAVRVFYAIRIALAAALTPAVLLAASLMFKNLNALELTGIALGAAAIGFYLPFLAVVNSIQKRKQSITEGLPDTLDLLLVCVEAGLGLDSALNRVAAEIVATNPVLSEQLRHVALEFQAGKGRSDALRNLARRTGVDDVKSFVTLLVHSDKLGTSIAQSLRVHAADMRAKRLMRAEEKANKVPVKVILPIGLFFLPCLLTLIFTPLIIRVLRVLAPALGVPG